MIKNVLNKIKKTDLKRLKKLRGFSVIIVPLGASPEAKPKHLTSGKVYTYAAIYTAVILVLGFFILGLTPLKGLIFPGESSLSSSDKKIVTELNQRLIFLTTELESLKSTNQQLKNAIMLGDSTLIDSLPGKTRSRNSAVKNPYGGNILYVVSELLSGGGDDIPGEFQFTIPLNGFISRGFDPEIGHMGIDIVAKVGTPVFAAAGGYVVFSDYTVNDGYMIILVHSDNYVTVYKHCSSLLKKARDAVEEGEIIALSGNTGEITTGPHLHFEVWKDGKPIDPKTVLNKF